MIYLTNRLKNLNFNIQTYQEKAQTILTHIGYPEFDLSILLTTNKTIKKYNATYRNKNTATDVLSFPFHQISAGTKIKAQNDDDKNLGDLIISIEYVQTACKKLGTTLDQRMNRLLIHGICHLLGYDHIEDDDFKVMIKKEKSIAKALNLDCSWE